MQTDTSPEADALQMKMLRAATPARRFQLACELSARAIDWARRGLEKARPDLDEQTRDLLFLEIHYGPNIARLVKDGLTHVRPTG